MTKTARQKRLSKAKREGKEEQAKFACPTPTKQRYETREQAMRQALKGSLNSLPQKVYRCKCGGYHTTTKA